MAAPRKTTEVSGIRQMVNFHLASKDSTPESRTAMAGLLETVLMRTNNYHGFKYRLSEYDFSTGVGELRENFDPTRREYY